MNVFPPTLASLKIGMYCFILFIIQCSPWGVKGGGGGLSYFPLKLEWYRLPSNFQWKHCIHNNFHILSKTCVNISLVYCPSGGSDGRKGKNTLIKVDKTELDLGAKQSVQISPGVSFF